MPRRARDTFPIAALALLLAGCAASPAVAPSVSASPTVPAPTATSPAPSVTPTASASPSPEPTMSAADAGQRCLDNIAQWLTDATVTGSPRVESRTVLPEWLVLVPVENENGPYTAFCYLGGDPADPQNDGVGGSETSLWTEEHIEWARHNNESM